MGEATHSQLPQHAAAPGRTTARKRQRGGGDGGRGESDGSDGGQPSCPSSSLAADHAGAGDMPPRSPGAHRGFADAVAHAPAFSALSDATAAGTAADSEGGSFFLVHINERPSRVAARTPYVNPRKLFGREGVLLQDVTVRRHPLLLLPCPHTGNVTVHPRHRYRLMKFVGEHLCLAGDFHPVSDEECRQRREDSSASARRRRQRREAWAASELMGMMAYLQSHPQSTPEDFGALPPEQAAWYHSRGRAALLGPGAHNEHASDDDDEAELNSEEDLAGLSGSDGDPEPKRVRR
ncbi:uncharacterized protein Tco025E_07377 [Trypanosoma conorhini]|uniref:Uncharacterized protein n=1 Tax=Trypanosoma conorhini TaxID=83891 RepID=A0A3R7L4F4_9TRYP|nr:uncharacterized protein Tco025E_07377 [Trypanosoma conorhini]RNF07385.1 hypothetical protein Tco025E_07377 [Trypanosoma conorhini]